MMEKSKHKSPIGIDLGTTYSVFQKGKPDVILSSSGNRTMPSIVAFTDTERIIDEGAEIQGRIDPRNTIYNAKRFIGKTFDDNFVQETIASYPFKVEGNGNRINFMFSF